MFKHPFSFIGRIRRLEYALSLLICWTLVVCCLSWMENIRHVIISEVIFKLLLIISCILGFVFLWFFVAQSVKRLHDTDHSGLFAFCYLIGGFNFFLILYLIFKDGDIYENEYGPDPKRRLEL